MLAVKTLSTTSYAILGLLALRPWTSYELAQQMRRSIRFYWPRAVSGIYEEPKKLVAHGYAAATLEHTGRRPRTVYAITDEGRRALRGWLEQPAGMPVVEFEGIVKVLFADQGSKQQAISVLRAIRADALAALEHHAALAAEFDDTGGPFPERLPVDRLVLRFMTDQAETVVRWSEWAEREVEAWP